MDFLLYMFNLILQSAERILITFLYDNIVESRRQAMLSMKTLAESAVSVENQDTYIHSEIESYLTTNDQKEIVRIVLGEKGGLREARNFYESGKFQNLRSLRGQITRQIESYPDHPGLVLTRAYIDLVNSDIDTDENAIQELNQGIEYAFERYSNTKQEIIEHLQWIMKDLYQENKEVALDSCKKLSDKFDAIDKYELANSVITEEEELVPFAYGYFAKFSDDIVSVLKN